MVWYFSILKRNFGENLKFLLLKMTELGHSALILQKWVSEWVSEWVSKSLSDKSRNRAAIAAKNLIAQLIYELSLAL